MRVKCFLRCVSGVLSYELSARPALLTLFLLLPAEPSVPSLTVERSLYSGMISAHLFVLGCVCAPSLYQILTSCHITKRKREMLSQLDSKSSDRSVFFVMPSHVLILSSRPSFSCPLCCSCVHFVSRLALFDVWDLRGRIVSVQASPSLSFTLAFTEYSVVNGSGSIIWISSMSGLLGSLDLQLPHLKKGGSDEVSLIRFTLCRAGWSQLDEPPAFLFNESDVHFLLFGYSAVIQRFFRQGDNSRKILSAYRPVSEVDSDWTSTGFVFLGVVGTINRPHGSITVIRGIVIAVRMVIRGSKSGSLC